MKEALKQVFVEELIMFKATEENSKAMLIRRDIMLGLMDKIQHSFILDGIPAKANEAKGAIKKVCFRKDSVIEILDELEALMNKLY